MKALPLLILLPGVALAEGRNDPFLRCAFEEEATPRS